MSVNLTVGGVAFPFPQVSDTEWGADVTAWATAVSSQMICKAGGAYTLSAELDLGGTAGIKALWFKSRTANAASAGVGRLARADELKWRNQANDGDLALGVNSSNQLTFLGTPVGSSTLVPTDSTTIDLTVDGVTLTADVIAASIANSHISASAAIAYSKLALTGSVVNADVNAAAAIAYSKLSLTGSVVNADVNAAAAIAYSKLNLAASIVNADINAAAAIAYSKLNLATSIVNADINAAAAIVFTKMAALTASTAVVTDASGFLVSGGGIREVLTANRTYYIRSDGSNSNTGLVDSAGGAFLTLPKAVEVVGTLDLSIYTATLKISLAGTYAGATFSGPHVGGPASAIQIEGDTTTPSNVVISSIISANLGARIFIKGVKIASSGVGLQSNNGSYIQQNGTVVFGVCTSEHISCDRLSIVHMNANYTIDGAAPRHWVVTNSGVIRASGLTITITGTPAFSSRFADAQRTSVIQANANTFSGSATGTRYFVDGNGVIDTVGGGATYLPGNVNGSATNGGQYL